MNTQHTPVGSFGLSALLLGALLLAGGLPGCDAASLSRPVAASPSPLSPPVWFQVDDADPEADTLTGYVLRTGRVGDDTVPGAEVALPPDSFVAGPFGDELVVGQNDGAQSQLEILNAVTGARRVIVRSKDVLRRATWVDDALYALVLDQQTREELGVYRFEVTSDQTLADGTVVLPPLARDETQAFGPTFATQLLATDGALVVQSCGELLCRTRVLDRFTGAITLRDELGQGELLGATDSTLVTYEAANGWPCKVLSIDI